MNFFNRGVNQAMEQAIQQFLIPRLANSKVFQQFAVVTNLLFQNAKQQGSKKIQDVYNRTTSASSSYTSSSNSSSSYSSSSSSSYNSYNNASHNSSYRSPYTASSKHSTNNSTGFNPNQTFQVFGTSFANQFVSKLRNELKKMLMKKKF